MKKLSFLFLLAISLLFISFPNSNLHAQPPLELAILLPLTGPTAILGIELRTDAEQAVSKVSRNLRVSYYDEERLQQPLLSTLIEKLVSNGNKAMIGTLWDDNIIRSMLPTIEKHNILTIFPVASKSLTRSIEGQAKNVFIIPESLGEIILAIDQSVRRAGPSDMSSLRNALASEAKKAQGKVTEYEAKIGTQVSRAIEEWEKERQINVEPSLKRFLESDFSSNYVSYIISFSGRENEISGSMQGVSRDTRNVLDGYLKVMRDRGKTTTQVSLESFVETGVNGCGELPCKRHCCDRYKTNNLDDCFKTMECK